MLLNNILKYILWPNHIPRAHDLITTNYRSVMIRAVWWVREFSTAWIPDKPSSCSTVPLHLYANISST